MTFQKLICRISVIQLDSSKTIDGFVHLPLSKNMAHNSIFVSRIHICHTFMIYNISCLVRYTKNNNQIPFHPTRMVPGSHQHLLFDFEEQLVCFSKGEVPGWHRIISLYIWVEIQKIGVFPAKMDDL